MHTKDFLAQELEKAGLPKMAKRARRGLYHDFLSPLDSPSLLLESDLQKAARLPEPTDDLRLSSGVVPLAHYAGGLTHLGLADYGAALPAVLDRGPEHATMGLAAPSPAPSTPSSMKRLPYDVAVRASYRPCFEVEEFSHVASIAASIRSVLASLPVASAKCRADADRP
ncbi:hypothetical protein [Sinorhizobium meliloti]|nr:hypothetical protein U8C39_36275 [Sinorhizobium meliloti]WQP20178.1 hypothetical protein U8C33_35120 [Sinorhizobium meliloti]WQP36140.1 hypothetical protein U8C45_37165 [Sinorhizobium meliloti]